MLLLNSSTDRFRLDGGGAGGGASSLLFLVVVIVLLRYSRSIPSLYASTYDRQVGNHHMPCHSSTEVNLYPHFPHSQPLESLSFPPRPRKPRRLHQVEIVTAVQQGGWEVSEIDTPSIHHRADSNDQEGTVTAVQEGEWQMLEIDHVATLSGPSFFVPRFIDHH